MHEQDNFSIRMLFPLLYLLIILYGISALIVLPFGLPIIRDGEASGLVVAVVAAGFGLAALHFILGSERGRSITPSVRQAALFSASVTILSFGSYIATNAYFVIKPAIPIINSRNYDHDLVQFSAWLFGGTLPSLWLIERVSEWQLFALDVSYNLFMPGLALSLMFAVYVQGLKGGVRLSIAQFIGLFVCLLIALLFPSQGPIFVYEDAFQSKLGGLPSGHMAQYLLAGVADYAHDPHGVPLVAGIAAMPSYHVFSWACGFMYWRYLPKPVLAIGVLACALNWLSTVALGWHYALDGLVSLLLVVPVWKISDEFIRLALRMTPLPVRSLAVSETVPAGVSSSPVSVQPPPFSPR